MTKPVTSQSLTEKIAKLPIYKLAEVDQFVEFLMQQSVAPKRYAKKHDEFPAFGMWAKQLEGKDSAAYSLELRKRAMRRAHERTSD